MPLVSPSNQIGLTVFVSDGAPATLDASGFGDLTWTEVADIEMWPESGTTSADQTVTTIKDGLDVHYNGAKDAGVLVIPYIYRATDPGQVIIRNRKNGGPGDEVSFKTVEADGTIMYFLGVLGPVRRLQIEASTHKGETVELRTIAEEVVG